MTENQRDRSRRKSRLTAFCGMAAGLSVAVMVLGGVLQIATFAAPLLAAVLLLPVRVEFGARAAWGTWFTAAVLSLLLGLDKELAFFYLFIGWWPIVKWSFDLHIRHGGLRLLAKVAVFASATAAMYGILFFAVGLPALVEELRTMSLITGIAFFVLMQVSLLLFDFLLRPVSFLYARRIRPRLRFLNRP